MLGWQVRLACLTNGIQCGRKVVLAVDVVDCVTGVVGKLWVIVVVLNGRMEKSEVFEVSGWWFW